MTALTLAPEPPTRSAVTAATSPGFPAPRGVNWRGLACVFDSRHPSAHPPNFDGLLLNGDKRAATACERVSVRRLTCAVAPRMAPKRTRKPFPDRVRGL